MKFVKELKRNNFKWLKTWRDASLIHNCFFQLLGP